MFGPLLNELSLDDLEIGRIRVQRPKAKMGKTYRFAPLSYGSGKLVVCFTNLKCPFGLSTYPSDKRGRMPRHSISFSLSNRVADQVESLVMKDFFEAAIARERSRLGEELDIPLPKVVDSIVTRTKRPGAGDSFYTNLKYLDIDIRPGRRDENGERSWRVKCPVTYSNTPRQVEFNDLSGKTFKEVYIAFDRVVFRPHSVVFRGKVVSMTWDGMFLPHFWSPVSRPVKRPCPTKTVDENLTVEHSEYHFSPLVGDVATSDIGVTDTFTVKTNRCDPVTGVWTPYEYRCVEFVQGDKPMYVCVPNIVTRGGLVFDEKVSRGNKARLTFSLDTDVANGIRTKFEQRLRAALVSKLGHELEAFSGIVSRYDREDGTQSDFIFCSGLDINPDTMELDPSKIRVSGPDSNAAWTASVGDLERTKIDEVFLWVRGFNVDTGRVMFNLAGINAVSSEAPVYYSSRTMQSKRLKIRHA